MYENAYIGRPEEKYRHKDPNELSPVGKRVERWREEAGLKVKEVVRLANEILSQGSRIDAKLYWAFLRGNERLTVYQVRAIAKVFGVSVYVMTHNSPEDLVDTKKPKPKTIKIDSPRKTGGMTPSKKTVRTQRVTGKSAGGTKKPVPYDADAAAKLLAKKFKVSRSK